MAQKRAKPVIFLSLVFTFIVVFSSQASFRITEDIFPSSLIGLAFSYAEQETPDQEIAEGMAGYYVSEDKEIDILFWRLRSEEIAKDTKNNFIEELKGQFSDIFDAVDWSPINTYQIQGSEAKGLTYRSYYLGSYVDGGLIFSVIEDYFIVVQIISSEGPVSVSELKEAIEPFITLLLGSPEEQEEEIRCGNNNCEYWEGESCKNCVYDCRLPGFCCFPDYSYILAKDYHNGVYDIKKNEAGLVPKGAIIIYPEKPEEKLPFSYLPSICDGVGMKTGECIYNTDCPSGVCAASPYYYCVGTVSEDIQEVEDKEVNQKIEDQAFNYKKEYVEAFEQIEGGIGQMVIKSADLEINLIVQGATAGRIPKVSEGDEIEARLEISNNSDYTLGLTAGIFYTQGFNLDEKQYTISFDWGASSLIGSFKTKLINTRLIIMPSGSKIVVYSNVVPEETGYLDVQGLVFFTTEKKYRKYDPGFLDEVPKDYQESEVSESIIVEKKPCDWWPICL